VYLKTMKKTLGLTEAQVGGLFRRSAGKCSICGRDFERTGKGAACVDHCHVTGRVRGVLCSRCNTILGFADDDPLILKAAEEYLYAFLLLEHRRSNGIK
jgi:hypothetical protein